VVADGTRILFTRVVDPTSGPPLAWVVWPLEGGTPLEIHPSADVGGGAAVWSPDGRFVLIFDDASGNLRIIDVESGADRVLEVPVRGIPSWQRLALP